MPDTSNLLSQFYFKIDGNQPPAALIGDLVEITVDSSLHLPDVATLTFNDPRLKWVDNDLLAPGKPLVISARAGRGQQPLFDGEIVEIEPDYQVSTQRMVVRAFDRLHRLARGRKVRTFQNMTDGEIVEKLAREAGLQAQVGPTKQAHEYVFQANQTNLSFLQERAADLGYLLFVEGKTLHCEAPKPDGQPIELQWGATLSEFRPRMTTIGQVNMVIARGWDFFARQEIVREAPKGQGAPAIGDNRTGGEVAQQAFRIDAQYLVADRPIHTQAVAEQLAQAMADKCAQHFVEAEATCGGNPAIVAGASVKLSAVGRRFGGTYFVTSATHVYNIEEGYTTRFNVSGLHPTTLLSMLLPNPDDQPIGGLVIGIVTDNQDPEGLGRVKVKYPWLAAEHASDWARVVSLGAGKQRGIEFLPEIDDEVLVGFELGDVHHPLVLGGLWNGIDTPPEESDTLVKSGVVQRRIVRSRAGHTITLDDSDDGGGVTIEDRNGNRIALDSKDNKLTIEVKGDAVVSAQGKLDIEASGDVTIKGANIHLNP
jgi:phage protein D